MKKKSTLFLDLVKFMEYLRNDYKRWSETFKNGCNDPFWEDGMNINLCRNHVIYAKRQLEELLGDNFFAYPIEYYYPEPKQVPNNHIVKDRKCPGGHFTATPKLCYNDFISFTSNDWREALEIPR